MAGRPTQLDRLVGDLEDGALVKGRTLKAVIRAMMRNVPIPGKGVLVREEPDGLVFDVGASGAAAEVCTFQASLAVDEFGARTFSFISGGLIGGILPSNLFVSDELWSDSLGTGTADWIVANVTTSNGVVTAVTLSSEASAPAAIGAEEGGPPSAFVLPLWFVGEASITRLIGCGNITLTAKQLFAYEKPDWSCGEWPLNQVWGWEVGS